MIRRLQGLAERLRDESKFYRLVLKHPRTPRLSKILLGAAIAYAVSPVDLVPDFIPVLGYADDAVILPLLVWLAIRWIPKDVLVECRDRAKAG